MKSVLVLSLAGFVPIAVFGDTTINAWTNATSSYWEYQTNWSLGVLPSQAQSVYITNSGWKAVAIGANTAQNFSNSMQIQDLRIASPVDSYNVFLMNFSGFQVPLQTGALVVGSNSSVVVQSSRLEADSVSLAGDFKHGDYSQVEIHGQIHVGSNDGTGYNYPTNAAYYLTNGTLSVDGNLSIGGFAGGGKLIQYGGSNNVGAVSISIEGECDLYDGELTATNGIQVGFNDYAELASFYQYGGNVNADTIINGHYTLNGGTLRGKMTMAWDPDQERVNASMLQNGGTNLAVSMDLGHPNLFGGGAFYVLSNGVVQVDSSVTFSGGQFSQYNGQNTIVADLVMQGRDIGEGNIYAEYLLAGGTLSLGGLSLEPLAHFQQSGGTNLIAGALVLSLTGPHQSTWYNLSGGTLMVKDIEIDSGACFQHASGNITQSGVLILDQGEWRAANGDHALGVLQLSGPNTNATGFNTNSAITFPNGSSILRLAKSSARAWTSDTILYITNWHGSTFGGGATQLYFGSDSSGLTTQQLAQIRFDMSGRLSPATMLTTGEVVPVAPSIALLQFTSSGGTLNLSWGPGWFLQSATNVVGPYEDVGGAASPYAAPFNGPQRFFRLKK